MERPLSDLEPDAQAVLTKTAHELFRAGAKAREEKYEEMKAAAVADGDSRNCIDLLALTRCETDRIGTDIEAWVDAWLRASESSGFSLGSWAEPVLADTADQLTSASVTRFATELASLFRSRAIPQSGEGFCEQSIRKGAGSALERASSRLRDEGLRIARTQMQESLRRIKVRPMREVKPWPGEIIVQHFPSPPPTPRPAEEAIRLFEASPEFPASQIWMHDRMSKLTASLKDDQRAYGSKPRARLALRKLDIRAAAFLRLVSNMELQMAFIALLDELELIAWVEFIGFVPTNIVPGAPTIAAGIERRKRWWRRQGYKQLVILAEAAKDPDRHSGEARAAKEKPNGPATWEGVEIFVPNDFHAQIVFLGCPPRTLSFEDMGFADGRGKKGKKPNKLWELLLAFARAEGRIENATQAGLARSEWPTVEQRVWALNRALKGYFGIPDTPIRFTDNGYEFTFKIKANPWSEL